MDMFMDYWFDVDGGSCGGATTIYVIVERACLPGISDGQ
jgi:hypothetical protein